jgi:ParB/RepB/Spo0J family partition protein
MTTPTTQQHRSRLLPDDPTYLRLRDATARRLSASLQRLVRELRGAHQTDQHTALADFITRQTAILQEAYIASYKAGAKDYYGETSMDAGHWAEQSPVNPQRMRQALAFYAPSIAKMAHQALGAVNAAPGMQLDELIAQADNTIRLFSFGRAFGGGRTGPHMGAGEFNAQHERWGNGRFRDMFNHAEHASHHAAVEEHGGGSGHGSKTEEVATAARKIKSPNEKATARVRKVAKAPVEHEGATHEAERIQNIAVGRIHVGLNPREHFDPEGIHELAASIREHGLLQPITVRPHTQDGKPGYQIIAGERRFRALQENGATRIPAIVRRVSDQEARELAIIENVNRADMRPLETARAYRGLRDSGMTPKQIATRLGKSEAHVQQHLDMLNLHPHVAQAVDEGRLHLGVVRDLAKLSHAGQQEAAERILRDDLGVRAGKALIKAVYGREHQGSLFEQRASLTKVEREAKGRYEDAIQKITAHLSRLDDETMGHMARAVDSPAREAERLKIMRAQLNKMQQLLENERAARDLGGVAASEYGAFRHYALDWIAQRQATIALAESWDGETVHLFSLGPHLGARPTGGIGGEHLEIRLPNGEFAGRRAGAGHQQHESQRGIHEHVAAQHHTEGQVAGGGRRLARPNEGAHRIQRDAEHLAAIRTYARARQEYQQALREAGPARQQVEAAREAYQRTFLSHRALTNQMHEQIAQRQGRNASTESIRREMMSNHEWRQSRDTWGHAKEHVERLEAQNQPALLKIADTQTELAIAHNALQLHRPGIHVRPDGPRDTVALQMILGQHAEAKLWTLVGGGRKGTLDYSALDGHTVDAQFRGPGHSIGLRIRRTRGNEVVIEHVIVESTNKTPMSGIRLIQTLHTFKQLGVAQLTSTAAKSFEMNGYDTWAKLGAEGSMSAHVAHAAQQHFGMRNLVRVEQVMALKGGPQWWKHNGDEFEATMNFRHGGRTAQKLDQLMARLEASGRADEEV